MFAKAITGGQVRVSVKTVLLLIPYKAGDTMPILQVGTLRLREGQGIAAKVLQLGNGVAGFEPGSA